MAWETRNWNPWAELARMQQEFDQLLRGDTGARTATGDFPAVNIWSDQEQGLLTAELPGIDPDKLEITVKDDAVTVRGNRQAETLKKGETWVRRERGEGAFARTFRLPFQVDADKVKADYQKGILQLTLPRAEEDKPRQIKVKAE